MPMRLRQTMSLIAAFKMTASQRISNYTLVFVYIGAIAKWLQRQIRNLFLFEGAGSNPAGVGFSSFQVRTNYDNKSIPIFFFLHY